MASASSSSSANQDEDDDTDDDTDDDANEFINQSYYLRYKLLIDDLGTLVLRKKFDGYIPPAKLARELKKSKAVGVLGGLGRKGKLTKKQQRYLKPADEKPKSKDFDITLLAILLQNICGLEGTIKCWNAKFPIDESDVSVEADIARLRNIRNEMSHEKPVLEETDFNVRWGNLEMILMRLANDVADLDDLKDKINTLKTRNLDVLTSELKCLRSKTPGFFRELYLGENYVETETYRQAQLLLTDNHIVIITGQPGEGKTTMAAQLALHVSDMKKCLVLSRPDDWNHVNLDLQLFDTIIIDDIFGAGATDQQLVKNWERQLLEIKRAVQQKNLTVLITTRHYILKDAKQMIARLPLFSDSNIVLLCSESLSDDEKIDLISSSVRRHNQVEIDQELMRQYANQSSKYYGLNRSAVFGFPECVDMFVRNEELFRQGAAFFRHPSRFFKTCLEDLYSCDSNHPQKFFALILVWINGGRLSVNEINESSPTLKQISESFNFDWTREMIKIVLTSLLHHKDGLLDFDTTSGVYFFRHKVIGDMVGVVTMQDEMNHKAGIKFCPREFFIENVQLHQTPPSEFTVSIQQYLVPEMVAKTLKLLLREDFDFAMRSSESFLDKRGYGMCSELVDLKNELDIGIINHKAFENVKFVQLFLDSVVSSEMIGRIFEVPVLCMSGLFYRYGIKMDKVDMCLGAYSELLKAETFCTEVFNRNVLSTNNNDRYLALLLAVREGDISRVNFFLNNGARVTGDTIYIAAHKRNVDILKVLLEQPGTDVNDKGSTMNGNNALIISSRKGFTEAVKCLIAHGANPAYQNDRKLTALHKAIIYKRDDIAEFLIDNGAHLDTKGGRFKRTALHIAADMGNVNIVKKLLANTALVRIKDHRGHYPIHCAAMRGRTTVVTALLEHDKTQDALKITSYGSKSKIRGMSLVHVAVLKKKYKMLDAVLLLGADPNISDMYGKTPIFYAIENKDQKCVKKLIEKANLHWSDKHGYSLLHAAIHQSTRRIVNLLCPLVNVNAKDKFGKTPLHVAVEKADYRTVHKLISTFGADYHMVTNRKDTVFHIIQRIRRKQWKDPRIAMRLNRIVEDIKKYDPAVKDQFANAKNKYEETAPIYTIPPYIGTGMSGLRGALLMHFEQQSMDQPDEEETNEDSDEEGDEEEDSDLSYRTDDDDYNGDENGDDVDNYDENNDDECADNETNDRADDKKIEQKSCASYNENKDNTDDDNEDNNEKVDDLEQEYEEENDKFEK